MRADFADSDSAETLAFAAHCALRFEGGDSQKDGSQLDVLPLRCTTSKMLLLRCTTFKIVNCDLKMCVCVCLSEEFSTAQEP